jgi:hypothetical protein
MRLLLFVGALSCAVIPACLAQSSNYLTNLQKAELDLQLGREGFDNEAIKLVRTVGFHFAVKEVCGNTLVSDEAIELAAKQHRVPLKMLVAKAVGYARIEIAHIHEQPSQLEYCRNIEKLEQEAGKAKSR